MTTTGKNIVSTRASIIKRPAALQLQLGIQLPSQWPYSCPELPAAGPADGAEEGAQHAAGELSLKEQQ